MEPFSIAKLIEDLLDCVDQVVMEDENCGLVEWNDR